MTAAASAAATVTATSLGPGPSLAVLGLVTFLMAQTCGCVPDYQASCSVSGLCAPEPASPCTVPPGIFTAHTHASLSHQTSLTHSKIKLVRIQDSSHRALSQTWDPSESRALCELALVSVLFNPENGSAEDILN